MADIVDTAMAAGKFRTLLNALQAAGLVETLKGPGPFTVFAPDDEAFAKLPMGTLDNLMKDPMKLKSVLTYHVVPGKLMGGDVVDNKGAKTVQGQDVMFDASKWHMHEKVKVNDAFITSANIMADNGIIHVIDKVLMPMM